MRIVFGIEYNGQGFCGWQRQANRSSIQEAIEKAASKVANETVSIVCAGRTDAGVHAYQQVAHFDSLADRKLFSWRMGCNSELPKSIRIVWAQLQNKSFHARYSAIARYYKYIILNRPTHSAHFHGLMTWCYKPLDVDRMLQGAKFLIGEHDFSSFRSRACQSKSPYRRLYHIGIRRDEDRIVIDVVGNAFLHHMVRNIVGVLMEIGFGDRPAKWAQQVLMARDRTVAGITAPPDGLYLSGIHYPEHFNIPSHAMFDILPEGVRRFDEPKL